MKKFVEFISSIFMILMMLMVFIDVILRYFFNKSFIAFYELEWHFFSIMFLVGISYALFENAHVRVDFLYDRLSNKKKALINIIGTILFLIPFSLLIIYGSYEFVLDSFETNEISQDPGGLPYRWLIKAVIPLGFVLLIISSFLYIKQNLNKYKN